MNRKLNLRYFTCILLLSSFLLNKAFAQKLKFPSNLAPQAPAVKSSTNTNSPNKNTTSSSISENVSVPADLENLDSENWDTPKQRKKPLRSSHLLIMPRFGEIKLSGKDKSNASKATLKSTEAYSLDLIWSQNWNPNFTIHYELIFQDYRFNNHPTRTVNKSTQKSATFGFGFNFKLNSSFNLFTHFFYGPQLYLNLPTQETLRVDRANTLSNSSGIKLIIAEAKPFNWAMLIAGRTVQPTEVDIYKSRLALAALAGFEMSHTLKSGSEIKAVFLYDYGIYNTEPIDQNQSSLSLGLGYNWHFE